MAEAERSILVSIELARALQLHQKGMIAQALEAYDALLPQAPDDSEVLYLAGTASLQSGNAKHGIERLKKASRLNPGHVPTHNNLGSAYQSIGKIDNAIEHYETAIALAPDHGDAHSNLGRILAASGQREKADAALRRALEINPTSLVALDLLGRLAQTGGDHATAINCFREVIKLQQNNALAHAMLGHALNESDEFQQALEMFENAITLNPKLVKAYQGKAISLRKLDKMMDALSVIDEALELDDNDSELHLTRANILRSLRVYKDAREAFAKAVELNPNFAEAYAGLSWSERSLGHIDKAIEHGQKAIELNPNLGDGYATLGTAFAAKNDHSKAIVAYGSALNRGVKSAKLLYSFGESLFSMNRHGEGLYAMQQVLDEQPLHYGAYLRARNAARHLCDHGLWAELGKSHPEARSEKAMKLYPSVPFPILSENDDPHDHKRHGETFSAHYMLHRKKKSNDDESELLSDLPKPPDAEERIRIAYFSNDFHEHATAYLIAELFELHDRSKFEIFAYCYTTAKMGPMRQRLMDAVDHFEIVQGVGGEDISRKARENGIHIFVDLKGWTMGSQSRILGLRPGPIQVNWLGYPGTLGSKDLDYIISDSFITPPEYDDHFTEKVVRLPDSYQLNDRKRVPDPEPQSRAVHGLPANALVFASLNQSYKIAPVVFEAWMKIMQQVPDSVLWLMRSNSTAEKNLRAMAQAHGISGERLVFAKGMAMPKHLARYALADIALDTFPYTSHTTGSDALWMGVPLVTMAGTSFPARVAGSLLRAAGLPELITENWDDFVEIVVNLATDAEALCAIRQKITATRDTCALFDSPRFVNNLEKSYLQMIENWRSGDGPQAITIE